VGLKVSGEFPPASVSICLGSNENYQIKLYELGLPKLTDKPSEFLITRNPQQSAFESK
jgi:hypothetical protein